RHEEAPLPHRRLERLRRPPVDGGVLAHARPLADLDPGLLTPELQVLRIAPDHRADPDRHVGRQLHVALERGARLEHRAVADLAPLADDGEGSDADIRPQLRLGRDDRGGMNLRAHRSLNMADMSASATTPPSTFATPFIWHIEPRIFTTSSSKRSWSP